MPARRSTRQDCCPLHETRTHANSILLAGALLIVFTACSPKAPAAAGTTPGPQNQAGSAALADAAQTTHQQALGPTAGPLPRFDGGAALQFVRRLTGLGPRWVGSPGHAQTESLLRAQLTQLQGSGLQEEEDAFTATTPFGAKPMRNFLAKLPGTSACTVVVAGHYDTLYERPDFVGANDGGSSAGLLLQLAKELSNETQSGRRSGCGVWLVWLDGEEAFQNWTATDSVYGSRHLAEKWQADGALKRIKAFLLVDMIGDADLNIDRDTGSTAWLEDMVYQAATRYGYQSHFFARTLTVGDDHTPFAERGVPVADLIDFDYGYGNAFWHTREDTLDKLSARSMAIVGSVVEETIRMLDHS